MSSQFEELKSEVMDVIDAYKKNKPKGASGIIKFIFEIASEFVEIVEVSSVIIKKNKKDTVVEGVKFAYNQLNIDIPWIPEPFETTIENWVLDTIVPNFIDWLVAKYNKKGIFKK